MIVLEVTVFLLVAVAGTAVVLEERFSAAGIRPCWSRWS